MNVKKLVSFSSKVIAMHLCKKVSFPLSMYIVLTNRCNNNCFYCRARNLDQNDKLTTRHVKKILVHMKEAGVFRIHLTGGEPMMREDIGEIISYAKQLGFFVGMSTNGYHIPSRINDLKEIDVVFLSYDGPPHVHARLRGKYNQKEVEAALSTLKRRGIRVWTTTVLTRWNVGYVNDIITFARKHHILANFNRLEYCLSPSSRLHPHIDEIRELMLLPEERKNVSRMLIQLKCEGAPIGSSFEFLKNLMEWPHDEQITDAKPSKQYQCWAGRAWGHLDYDGQLYACGWGALRGSESVDVLEKKFKLSWKELPPLSDCRSCSHACGVENNLLFSLNISSIINALKQILY